MALTHLTLLNEGAGTDPQAFELGSTHRGFVQDVFDPDKEPPRDNTQKVAPKERTDMTLNEVLNALGLTTREHLDVEGKEILDGGTVVFTGPALGVWRWLHETGRWPAKTNGAVTPELAALVETWKPPTTKEKLI